MHTSGLYLIADKKKDFDINYFEDVKSGKRFLSREIEWLQAKNDTTNIIASMISSAQDEKVRIYYKNMTSLYSVSASYFLFQALMGGYRPIPYIPDMVKLNEAEIIRDVIAQQAQIKRFCVDSIGKPGHDKKNGEEIVKYSANEALISNPVPEEKLKAIMEKAKATRQSNSSNVELSQNRATTTSQQNEDVHALVSAELKKRAEEAKKKNKKKKQTADPLTLIKDKKVQQVETNKQHWDNASQNANEVYIFKFVVFFLISMKNITLP
jgi:hypothetical protein